MINPYNAKIGKKINTARKRKKMSLRELGEEIGLHESTVSRYEKGEIKALELDVLDKFATALNISFEYLIQTDELSKQIEEIIFMDLNDDELDDLLFFAKYILKKRNK